MKLNERGKSKRIAEAWRRREKSVNAKDAAVQRGEERSRKQRNKGTAKGRERPLEADENDFG